MEPQWDLYVTHRFSLQSRFTTTRLRGLDGGFSFFDLVADFATAAPESVPMDGPVAAAVWPHIMDTRTAAAAARAWSPAEELVLLADMEEAVTVLL